MDRKKSKADDAEAVQIIRGSEALGYEGAGRDNKPEDIKPSAR